MEITGYQLREALKRWRLRRDTTDAQFKDSLYAFPEEKKPKPEEIAAQFKQADMAVAKLQELQQEYNSKVMIEVDGDKISLSYGIKLVGGAGRVEKMFRQAAATDDRERRFNYGREMTRKADDIVAQKQIKTDQALELCDQASKYAGRLRAAIAYANAQKISLNVPPELME